MLTQNAPPFDFIGMTTASPWYIYAPLAFILLFLTAFTRRWQLTN